MPSTEEPAYYCLNAGSLPDELYKPTVPVSAWLSRCTTAGADGFPAGSLATLDPIPLLVLCERLIGIPLYMLLNVLPFAVPLLLLTGLFKLALLYYILPLFLLGLVFWAVFHSKGIATGEGKGHRAQQYLYTERNSTRYVSLKMVWPASLHFPTHEGKQLIFCAIPHGLAPLGIVFTIVFTYVGFGLLAAAVAWNANVVDKLKHLQKTWRRLRGQTAPIPM